MASFTYRERLWLSPWITLLLVALIVILSSVSFAQEVYGVTFGNGQAPIWLLLGFDATFILLLANFLSLTIELTPDALRVSYGILRKTIRVEEILSAGPTKASYGVYGGEGVRMGSDNSLAFTTSMGDAVRVIARKGRPFVFSCRRPDHLSRIVQALVEEKTVRR